MFETLTTEVILSLTTVGVSGIAVCGLLVALNATHRKQDNIDIDAVVRDAPYGRLHNIVMVKDVST